MKKESISKLWIVSIFAVAMAFLETAVVVYIRKIYYPDGFNFPLNGFVDSSILGIEWVREFATIVMLAAIGILAARKFYGRIAYFLYAFAIWDIFYYVFLKLTIAWPPSFLTWDLLFLIPWAWAGPVITPIIWSIMFIILAFMIINFEDKGKKIKFSSAEWALFILGAMIVLYTWLIDYGKLIFSSGFAGSFLTLSQNAQFAQLVSSYIPASYNWPLFVIGTLLAVLGIILFCLRTSRQK